MSEDRFKQFAEKIGVTNPEAQEKLRNRSIDSMDLSGLLDGIFMHKGAYKDPEGKKSDAKYRQEFLKNQVPDAYSKILTWGELFDSAKKESHIPTSADGKTMQPIGDALMDVIDKPLIMDQIVKGFPQQGVMTPPMIRDIETLRGNGPAQENKPEKGKKPFKGVPGKEIQGSLPDAYTVAENDPPASTPVVPGGRPGNFRV